VCGGAMKSIKTGIPFKMCLTMTVIINNLPVIQCESCGAYIFDDLVLKQVDKILDNVNTDAQLEVIGYHEK
jgi:YgiT-type zinc finger domain-containing protein